MAIFSRKSLARGTKLVAEQVYKLPEEIAAAFGAASLDTSNIDKAAGLVEINFNLVALDSDYFCSVGTAVQYLLPFCLPPLQENFSPTQDAPAPRMRLEHLTFAFDQSCEAAAVTDRRHASGPGLIDFAGVQNLDMVLTLSEKTQWFFNQASTQHFPERQLLSVPLTPPVFADEVIRLNPAVLSTLNIDLDPYRTYVLAISIPGLRSSSRDDMALPSVHISLGVRMELVERDKGADIQNLPAALGAQVGETVTVTRPAKNTAVRANGATGIVDGALWLIDQVLSRRLAGGYTRDGRPSFREHIKTDACYDVIALPFFGNEAFRAVIASVPTSLDYTGVAPYTAAAEDERRVPLYYPISVHHVVAIANYAFPAQPGGVIGPGYLPVSNTFSNKIGVGIVAHGDTPAYEQVAYLQWYGNQPTTNLIDRVKQQPTGATAFATRDAWSHELRSVPLTMRGATAGTGYYAQGKPFFCGKGAGLGGNRTNVGTRISGGNAAPLTGGREGFLYARWQIQDTLGLSTTVAVPPGAAADPQTTYVGHGGHWVLIFGKRHLVGADNELA